MYALHDIRKVYTRRGHEVLALQIPALQIERGEHVAMIGPSGSGKTTLLSMLGGMLSPTTGRVLLDEVSIYDQNPEQRAALRRQRIGFVFQTFNLVPYLSALENVQVPLYLAGVSPAEQRQRAAEMLARVGLADRMHHKPTELSVGQQQRVALARTVANAPAVILADEPTGNLDPQSRTTVLDFFAELHREGRTIVLVTHDPAVAARAARVISLAEGMIASDTRCHQARAA